MQDYVRRYEVCLYSINANLNQQLKHRFVALKFRDRTILHLSDEVATE